MRTLYYLILVTSFLTASIQSARTQTTLPSQISAGIKKWDQENPQEKIYLQIDRTHYFAAEKIWFKLWTFIDQQPAFLSRIVYADLINDSGRVILKQMYQLDSLGSSSGYIELPSDMKSGNYSVRCYTLWMLNYPSFIATEPIYIYNIDYKTNSNLVKPALYIQFFPEGGQMVEGLTSRIAFKAVNEKGLPVTMKAKLTDNNGKTITTISTEHDGMGVFEFTPASNTNYKVQVDGVAEAFVLPKAEKEGISIRIDNSKPARVFVSVERNETNKDFYNRLYLSATINGKLIFLNELNFDEGLSAAAISKKDLPPGILQITFFHPNGSVVAERLAFIDNYTVKKPSITQTNIKEQKGITYLTFRIDSLSTVSNSLLCSDASLAPPPFTTNNLLSSLLLTSDLKGNINNPGYYIEDKSTVRLKHLDLLLMTHGWKRYNWKDVIAANSTLLKFPVETSIHLKGKVTKSDRLEVVKDGKVSFIIKAEDSTTMLSEATLTDRGEFLVDDINFFKKANVYYQGTNSKKENFVVDVTFYPSYIDTLSRSSDINFLNLDTISMNQESFLSGYLQSNLTHLDSTASNYKNLKEIVIQGKRKLPRKDSLNIAYASPGIFQSGLSLDPSERQSNQNIWYYLQSQVPGLRVEGIFNPNVYFTRYSDLQIPGSEEPLADAFGNREVNGVLLNRGGIAFYLNEINVPQEVVETLVLSDVALVKVLRTEAAALGIPTGAIAIYTKKGAQISKPIYEKDFSNRTVTGYTVSSSFYALPVNTETSSTPQSTLLWNAGISPKDKSIVIAVDQRIKPKAIRFVLQGVDEDGNINLVEKIIEINYK
jgi:hypothetical protein